MDRNDDCLAWAVLAFCGKGARFGARLDCVVFCGQGWKPGVRMLSCAVILLLNLASKRVGGPGMSGVVCDRVL